MKGFTPFFQKKKVDFYKNSTFRGLETRGNQARGSSREAVRAPRSGRLHISAQALGKACAQLGGGRQREGEEIDHTVGILLKKRAGDRVAQGEELAHVCYREPRQEALALAQGAFTVSASFRARPLVHCIISKEDI